MATRKGSSLRHTSTDRKTGRKNPTPVERKPTGTTAVSIYESAGTNTNADVSQKPITVQFQVHMKSDVALNTYPFETKGNVNRVYVVGDEEILGQWTPANAVPMIRTSRSSNVHQRR